MLFQVQEALDALMGQRAEETGASAPALPRVPEETGTGTASTRAMTVRPGRGRSGAESQVSRFTSPKFPLRKRPEHVQAHLKVA